MAPLCAVILFALAGLLAEDCLIYLIMGQLLRVYGSVWLGLRDGWTPAAGMEPVEATVLGLAYAPLFAWPLVLTVALVGYWRRRSPLRPAGAPVG